MAARAVLAGTATAIPKAGDGDAEMIPSMLKMARDSAVKAQTKAINQIRAILIGNAPTPLREELTGLTTGQLLNRRAALPRTTGPDHHHTDPATQYTLRLLAQRYLQLRSEANQIKTHLRRLTDPTAPALTAITVVRPDGAATFLTAAGDNPDRLHSEAAFAALCGSSPIPASSGKTKNRHRLNRGGSRQANAALHRARRRPLALARIDPEVHGPPPRRRQRSRQRGHALPQALHRPRGLPRAHPTRASHKGSSRGGWTSIGASTAASPPSYCSGNWPGPGKIRCSATCCGPGRTRCNAGACS